MPRPICAKCEIEMNMKELGVSVLFKRRVRGTIVQQPYKLHLGDSFVCPACRAEVVIYNPRAAWEHFQSEPMPEPTVTVYEP